MSALDIGIDLGTSTILAGSAASGTLAKEPSIVAVNKKSGKVLAVGTQVYNMVGRTPDYIDVIRPLSDGVISHYKMTGTLIRHILGKIHTNRLLRPRLIICVPSAVTEVESQSIVDAAIKEAGARQVFLLEEPMAAALGAGLDISQPIGRMIVDIGGGTTDVAVLSLWGTVCKASAKVSGHSFDEVIVRHMRSHYHLLIGEKTAEEVKVKIGSVWPDNEDCETEVKGRDIVTGLPGKAMVTRAELIPALQEVAAQILQAAQSVLERTPPELVGDIRTNGLLMTGGGAMINGLDQFLSRGTTVACALAENPVECVAKGTIIGFDHRRELFEGFSGKTNRTR